MEELKQVLHEYSFEGCPARKKEKCIIDPDLPECLCHMDFTAKCIFLQLKIKEQKKKDQLNR